MKPIEIHRLAAKEANRVVDYYEALSLGLGEAFRIEFEAALARIRHNPEQYAEETNSVRICPLHRFPYSIYYEIMADRIWIAAVGYQHRRPGYWSRRKPD